MLTEQQVIEQAKRESIAKVTQYAPHSYKAGFVDGAMWVLAMMEKTKNI